MEKEFLNQLNELNSDVKYSLRIMDSILMDLVNEKDVPVPTKKVNKRSFFARLFGRKQWQ